MYLVKQNVKFLQTNVHFLNRCNVTYVASRTKRFRALLYNGLEFSNPYRFQRSFPESLCLLPRYVSIQRSNGAVSIIENFPVPSRSVFSAKIHSTPAVICTRGIATNPKEARIAYIYPVGKVAPSRFSS